MSDPASGGSAFSGIGPFIEEHRTAAIVIGGAVFVFVMYEILKPAPAAQTAPVVQDDSGTQAAAAIVGAQTAANGQTALATIAAGVTDSQTAAAQTVALATIQGQTNASVAASSAATASAYYGAATEIAGANSAVAIAQTQAARDEQIAGDSVIGSEFSNLADVLKSFGANTQAIVNNPNVGTGGGTPLLPIPAGGAAGFGSPFNAITSALVFQSGVNSTVATNNQILASNATIAANDAAQRAATGASAISSFGSWLNGLLGSFTQTTAAVAAKTVAPSATAVASLNLSPLAGGPQAPNLASISAF